MDSPSRYFLKTLSFFISDEKHVEKLRELSSKTSVNILLITYRMENQNITGIV